MKCVSHWFRAFSQKQLLPLLALALAGCATPLPGHIHMLGVVSNDITVGNEVARQIQSKNWPVKLIGATFGVIDDAAVVEQGRKRGVDAVVVAQLDGFYGQKASATGRCVDCRSGRILWSSTAVGTDFMSLGGNEAKRLAAYTLITGPINMFPSRQ